MRELVSSPRDNVNVIRNGGVTKLILQDLTRQKLLRMQERKMEYYCKAAVKTTVLLSRPFRVLEASE